MAGTNTFEIGGSLLVLYQNGYYDYERNLENRVGILLSC